jgi:hypothetical protein
MRRSSLLVPIIAFSLASSFAAAQQTSGDLVGTVKDATGAVIPGASITVTNEATGTTNTETSSSAGDYRAGNLLPGRYDLVVSAAGFQTYRLNGVVVDISKASTANVALSVGTSQTVEVNADAGVVLDTTTTNLSQTFSNEELSVLPTATVGFGVLNASLLSPGVASTGGIGIGQGPSVGGQRPRNNNFTLEGIDNNSKGVTGPLLYVPNDAVGSFTLITNQFSPEFGHSSGGQFNVNVLSGTNRFHGKVYEYFENRKLNAGSGTTLTKQATRPRYDYNRYGGQLGGPIFRDKLFFFGNFERQTTGQNQNYALCTPTASGLTQLGAFGAANGLNATNLAEYLKYTPAATATGPGGTGIDAGVDAACGNTKTGPQTLTVTGGGNSAIVPLGNYEVTSPIFTNFDALTTSVDYTLSEKDSIRVRYLYNTQGTLDTAANLPVFFTTLPSKFHLFALSEFHSFTANLTNEFRVGYNRYANITPSGPFTFPGLDQFPNLTFNDQGQLNYGPDGNAPQSTVQNLYQATDNVSYIRGKHTLKFGFDGRKYISPQTFTQRSRGDYQYSTLSNYLNDLAPDIFGERSTGNNIYYGDQIALYGYGNDTWRVSPTVTLNLGLRYEFTSIPFGERLQALNKAASVPGVLVFNQPKPQYTNFAPRVGINWAPDAKTSIRAGYGIAYDVLFDNLGLLSGPPQFGSTNDVGSGSSPNAGDPNFLAKGGLPPATGSGLTSFCLKGTGGTTGVPCSPDIVSQQQATAGYVPDQKLPYAESYTLTVQRTFGSAYTAEIGYIGTRGIHLPVQDQINIFSPLTQQNQLPTSLTGSTTVTAAPGASTLSTLIALPHIKPQFLANNFTSKITSYQPFGGSNYNALVTNLQRRFQNGLQMNLSYTWSKTMDDSTAEVFATVLTPRRPQDPSRVSNDYSRSALDRTNRITLEAVYDLPFFKHSNFLLKNLVGNWTFSPIYTYESPEFATVLSGPVAAPAGTKKLFTNGGANLDRDSTAIGRAIINPNGVKGTASGVRPQFATNLVSLCPAGVTQCRANLVGYVAINPNAYYIQAGQGTLPNSSRNNLATRPTDNLDLTAIKRITFFDHYNFEFGAQAFNVLNHAQYTPGSVDTINATAFTSSTALQTTNNSFFNHPEKVFSNNARVLQLSGKISF